jgi:transcriptional regulator with XRE-family HTH domain
VTVGESLSQARYQAGLTIDELSERTKIRASVIRSIESDDYEACGGDLYVRGYVRAIAGAVGVDAQGLIRDYDRERVRASGDADATMFDLPAVAPTVAPADPGSADGDGGVSHAGGQDPDETRFDLPAVHEDSAATRFDIPAVRADPAEDLMAAGYEVQPAAGGAGAGLGTPVGSARPQDAGGTPGPGSGSGSATGRGRRRLLAGVAAVAVLVVAGVLGVSLASGSTTGKNTADSTAAQASAAAKAGKSASPATSAAADSKPATSPTATPSATAKPTPTQKPHVSPPVTRLPLSAAEAFGPGGPGDGDNPSGAGYVLASDPPLPWSTNWYATAKFGMLKSGTGLLLTLDHQSTITSVRIDLTHYQGVNLQLKAGTSLQDFKVVATADNTGGTVRLTLRHPASARYLLIWFTLLPPNGDGQYQESVYHVVVNGHR